MPAITSTSSRQFQPVTVPVGVVSDRQRVREAAPGVVRAHRSCARAHVAHGAQRARRVTKCTRGSRRVFVSPLVCRPTAKPRRTSSPSICQRNNIAIHFALASRIQWPQEQSWSDCGQGGGVEDEPRHQRLLRRRSSCPLLKESSSRASPPCQPPCSQSSRPPRSL